MRMLIAFLLGIYAFYSLLEWFIVVTRESYIPYCDGDSEGRER